MSSPVYPIYEVPLAPLAERPCPQSRVFSEKSHDAYTARNCKAPKRTAEHHTSMPHSRSANRAKSKERIQKVDNWMENVPIYELDKQRWESQCYDSNFSANWEEDDMEDSSSKVNFQTTDELLYLLAKKFEAVVRKTYQLEKEPTDISKETGCPQLHSSPQLGAFSS